MHRSRAALKLVQATERSSLMPSEGMLALHNEHVVYHNFEAFYTDLHTLLQQGALLEDCNKVTRALGILEPFTEKHIQPEALLIEGAELQGINHRQWLAEPQPCPALCVAKHLRFAGAAGAAGGVFGGGRQRFCPVATAPAGQGAPHMQRIT
jgi:hypothetical protein